MRLFVAVTLPDAVQEGLGGVQERLRRAQADVSWVRQRNLHATLKFLGEVEAVRLERLRAALAVAAGVTAPFEAVLAGVGTFGGRVPRVVWVGVRDGAEALTALAARVETSLARLGVPRERRGFSAHLTLGRVRSPRNLEALLAAVRDEAETPLGRVTVGAIALVQSELDPAGSIYTELDRFALGGVDGERDGGAHDS
jgi:RNA 2',3'-cyclic 3'-phosphodiesterase